MSKTELEMYEGESSCKELQILLDAQLKRWRIRATQGALIVVATFGLFLEPLARMFAVAVNVIVTIWLSSAIVMLVCARIHADRRFTVKNGKLIEMLRRRLSNS